MPLNPIKNIAYFDTAEKVFDHNAVIFTEFMDWMELNAFFAPDHAVNLDSIWISFIIGSMDEPVDGVEEEETLKENFLEQFENAVEQRKKMSDGNYPFDLSDDAELFFMKPLVDQTEPELTYLVCLFATDLTKSTHLEKPLSGNTDIKNTLQNDLFQEIATVAISGRSRGSSVRMGWPRRSGEVIRQVLARANEYGANFDIRHTPKEYEPPQAKDGGIDGISWLLGENGLPVRMYFSQVASGANWTDKPASSLIESFFDYYLASMPSGNHNYATIIPFILEGKIMRKTLPGHKDVIARFEIPKLVKIAIDNVIGQTDLNVDNYPLEENLRSWISEVAQYTTN